MPQQIQHRYDPAATWASNNPILAIAERGYETDSGKWKTGDGASAWNSLDYDASGTDSDAIHNNVSAEINAISEKTAPVDDDLVLIEDSESPTPYTKKKVKMSNLPSGGGSTDGWINPGGTWIYASVDDPTGIFKVNADVTTKYSAGMRIKMTNGGNVIYGIITVVNAYGADESGYTYIKFLHEIDPTDSLALYLMANSVITNNYYSNAKAPTGFPIEENKWTVRTTSYTTNYETTPSTDTWYNNNSINISLPIGSWKLGFSCYTRSRVVFDTTVPYLDLFTTLSTSSSSETIAKYTVAASTYNTAYANKTGDTNSLHDIVDFHTVTTKTIMYLLCKYQSNQTPSVMGFAGSFVPTILKAVCAYL